MKRTGRFTKLVVLLALPAILVSCHVAVAPNPNASVTPTLSPAPSPSGWPSNSASTSASPTIEPTVSPTIKPSASPSLAKMTLALYYVGKTNNGLRLYREFRSVMSTDDMGLYSLQALVRKKNHPFDMDYYNLWGNGSVINYVRYSGSRAVVDIAVVPLKVGAEAEMRAIDQLVWTLTANHPSTTSVTFTSSGKSFESFAGHVDARQIFSRELHYEVLAPVWVDQVAAVMTSPVIMRGTACTFEAGVHWQLFRNGELIREKHVLASGACPVRGGWSVNLGMLREGHYMFAAQDISAKDGSVTQEDTKEFVIR